MNAPDTQRAILRHHIATVEARYPLKIIGRLPRGAAAHVFEDDALDFLAEKRPGLSYFGIAGAEIDLGGLLGHPVGLVMVSELQGRDADGIANITEPL